MLINPVSGLLEGISTVVVHHAAPSLPWVAYSCGMAVALFAVSLTAFKKLEPYFAESI